MVYFPSHSRKLWFVLFTRGNLKPWWITIDLIYFNCSNIFVKCIYVQLYSHLSMHQKLYSDQYGFRAGQLTDLALVKMLWISYQAWENKQSIIAVMMDRSKTFDSLHHAILLLKLKSIGIWGPSLSWIKSNLSGNQIDNVYSGNILLSNVDFPRAQYWVPCCI